SRPTWTPTPRHRRGIRCRLSGRGEGVSRTTWMGGSGPPRNCCTSRNRTDGAGQTYRVRYRDVKQRRERARVCNAAVNVVLKKVAICRDARTVAVLHNRNLTASIKAAADKILQCRGRLLR